MSCEITLIVVSNKFVELATVFAIKSTEIGVVAVLIVVAMSVSNSRGESSSASRESGLNSSQSPLSNGHSAVL